MNTNPQDHGSSFSSYLGLANNVRKNLLRLYRKQKWKINHLLLFPIVFLYYEFLLKLFGPGSIFSGFFYVLLFSLGYGLLGTALTCGFRPKVNRIISMVLLYGVGLLFVVECLVRDTYQSYMTISGIMAGAGGVMTGYSSELFSAIFHGLPKIIPFFLPAIFYTVTGRRRVPARRYHPVLVGVVLACSLVVTGMGVLTANIGTSRNRYSNQFDFNTATTSFGLMTSTRLNTKYQLLGGRPQLRLCFGNRARRGGAGPAPIRRGRGTHYLWGQRDESGFCRPGRIRSR